MIIKVKGYLLYRDVIGEREIERPDDAPVTLLDLIQELAADLGGEHGRALYDQEAGSITPAAVFMLNGVHLSHLPDRLHTLLRDGDQIAVFQPGAGG